MKFLFLLFIGTTFSQNLLHLPQNRKLFADHLYCTGDYLRAAGEYELFLVSQKNDTAEFKIALSLAALERNDEALSRLNRISINNIFSDYVIPEKVRIFIRSEDYEKLNEIFPVYSNLADSIPFIKLRNAAYLFREKYPVPSPPYLNTPFSEEEKKDITSFYEMKMNLPSKNPQLAGFLSAVLPGLGKVYTEEYSDAFFAAFMTGISGYLAYTNFRADHRFRGYLFSGIAAWFYGGNIYGSVASAQIYNAKIKFSFTSLLLNYLEEKNYFLPDYGFCK